MAKYFSNIMDRTEITTSAGSCINLGHDYYTLSSTDISACSFAQSQIQRVIFDAYSAEVGKAGHCLKQFATPRSRLDFLNSYNKISGDLDLSVVFTFAKGLFFDIYNLRNILAHDIWLTSDDFPECLLLASLDESARLLFSSSKLMHSEGTTSQQIYSSMIRYIRSLKLISLSNLEQAVRDIDLCNWCLMQISLIVNEKDPEKAFGAKRCFYAFPGVSHLFPEEKKIKDVIFWSSKNSKSITI